MTIDVTAVNDVPEVNDITTSAIANGAWGFINANWIIENSGVADVETANADLIVAVSAVSGFDSLSQMKDAEGNTSQWGFNVADTGDAAVASYTITDADSGKSNTGTITIPLSGDTHRVSFASSTLDLTDINDAPVGDEISYATQVNGSAFTVNVSDIFASINAADIEGSTIEESDVAFTTQLDGDATAARVMSNSNQTIQITPSSTGDVEFYYMISDPDKDTIKYIGKITAAIEDLIVQDIDISDFTLNDGAIVRIAKNYILENAVTYNGDKSDLTVTMTKVSGFDSLGTLKDENDDVIMNTLTVTGNVNVKYTISDGNGNSGTGNLTVDQSSSGYEKYAFTSDVVDTDENDAPHVDGIVTLSSQVVDQQFTLKTSELYSSISASISDVDGTTPALGDIKFVGAVTGVSNNGTTLTDSNKTLAIKATQTGDLYLYANVFDDVDSSNGKTFMIFKVPIVAASAPIALDMDGDGLEYTNLQDSNMYLDIDNDGSLEHIAWVAPDDAVLVYDKNENNQLDGIDEVSFVSYKDGAVTDLEGLQAFDSNDSMTLEQDDKEWDKFKVWQDKDADGDVDAGELIGLEESGIVSLDLISDENYQSIGDVIEYGQGSYTNEDGSEGILGDVAFVYESSYIELNFEDSEAEVEQSLSDEALEQTLEEQDTQEEIGERGSESNIVNQSEQSNTDDGAQDQQQVV